MHSLRLGCKNSCQNLLVHRKFTLDVSTKCHAIHSIRHLTPPPPPRNGNFSSGLDLENLKLTFGNWLSPTPPPPPLEMEISSQDRTLKILILEIGHHPPPPPPQNENLDLLRDGTLRKLIFDPRRSIFKFIIHSSKELITFLFHKFACCRSLATKDRFP